MYLLCMLILLIKKINTITRVSQNCHSVPSGQGIIRCRNDSLGKHCTAGERQRKTLLTSSSSLVTKKKIRIFEAQKHIWNLLLQNMKTNNCSCVQQNRKGKPTKREFSQKPIVYLGNKLEIVNNAQE